MITRPTPADSARSMSLCIGRTMLSQKQMSVPIAMVIELMNGWTERATESTSGWFAKVTGLRQDMIEKHSERARMARKVWPIAWSEKASG